ncbi:MAG: helix-turn-helix transcriptional regulator, partial [Pyramidobacter sp.]
LGAAALLSEREREVAGLVARGLTNDEIARQMHVSVATVKSFLTRAFRKTGVASRAELAAWLLRWEN